MNTIKKYLKILLNSTKLVFNLRNLTKEEMAGHFSWKTKIRLFPKTTIRLPFILEGLSEVAVLQIIWIKIHFLRWFSQVLHSKKR